MRDEIDVSSGGESVRYHINMTLHTRQAEMIRGSGVISHGVGGACHEQQVSTQVA